MKLSGGFLSPGVNNRLHSSVDGMLLLAVCGHVFLLFTNGCVISPRLYIIFLLPVGCVTPLLYGICVITSGRCCYSRYLIIFITLLGVITYNFKKIPPDNTETGHLLIMSVILTLIFHLLHKLQIIDALFIAVSVVESRDCCKVPFLYKYLIISAIDRLAV